MKLYTKQDLIDLVESLKNYTHESHSILGHDEREAKEFVDIFLKDRNPIELPSEEEIDAFINKNFISHGEDNWQRKYFKAGAKWIKDKIQGGNK